MRETFERDPEGLLAPEALYWWGIAVYLKTHSNDEMYQVWDVLRERFPVGRTQWVLTPLSVWCCP